MSGKRTFSPASPLLILIVDDFPIARLGLDKLLEMEPDFAVCGMSPTGQDALEKVRLLRPDIVLLDLILPDIHGMEVIKRIKADKSDQTLIVVISMCDECIYAERALEAGAHAYIMKSEAASKIVEVIRKVVTGNIYVSQVIVDRMLKRVGNGVSTATTQIESLTDRELEIFVLLGQGKTVRAIAEHLNLSFKTVESHINRIRTKLVVESLHSLIVLAVHWVQSGFGSDIGELRSRQVSFSVEDLAFPR